jgi:hypothetical protein
MMSVAPSSVAVAVAVAVAPSSSDVLKSRCRSICLDAASLTDRLVGFLSELSSLRDSVVSGVSVLPACVSECAVLMRSQGMSEKVISDMVSSFSSSSSVSDIDDAIECVRKGARAVLSSVVLRPSSSRRSPGATLLRVLVRSIASDPSIVSSVPLRLNAASSSVLCGHSHPLRPSDCTKRLSSSTLCAVSSLLSSGSVVYHMDGATVPLALVTRGGDLCSSVTFSTVQGKISKGNVSKGTPGRWGLTRIIPSVVNGGPDPCGPDACLYVLFVDPVGKCVLCPLEYASPGVFGAALDVRALIVFGGTTSLSVRYYNKDLVRVFPEVISGMVSEKNTTGRLSSSSENNDDGGWATDPDPDVGHEPEQLPPAHQCPAAPRKSKSKRPRE